MTVKTISKTPPKHLAPEAQTMWKIIVPYLTSQKAAVQAIDSNLVELYCSQYGIYRQAYADIQEHGIQTESYKTVQNSAGNAIGQDFQGYKRNPATTIYNDALKQLIAIGAQLGLSPKSRSELNELAKPGATVDVAKAIRQTLGGKL